jgi:predicted O-methyltransferase YrrM
VAFLISYAQQPTVKSICEIGFAAGHSGSAMLWANPGATFHSFDIEELPWAHTQLAYVNSSFGGRVHRYGGDSAVTVPPFNGECDLAFVDGLHDGSGPITDFLNILKKMRKGSILLADDTNVKSCPAVAAAWSDIKARGLVTELECNDATMPDPGGWWQGWCAAQVL